jgi:hypothetical protein
LQGSLTFPEDLASVVIADIFESSFN